MKRLCLAAALLATTTVSLAQNTQVFRCEDAGGRVTYSDEACKGGTALNHSDTRSDAERKAAAEVLQREERLAEKLARERRAAEQQAAGRGPGHIAHSAANEAAKDGAKKPAPKKKPAAKKSKDEKKAAVQA